MKYRMLICAASALVLGGCFGGSDHSETTTAIETARGADLPSSLKYKDSGSGKDDYMLNPLQRELKHLSEQEAKLNQELAEYKQKRQEYGLREQEINNRLTAAQQRIKKVNAVIKMIDRDPHMLDQMGGLSSGGNGGGLDVPSISDNGPLGGEMPALSSDNNTLGGGPEMPSLAPAFNSQPSTPRNELTSAPGGLPGFGNTGASTQPFEAAPAFPTAGFDEPAVADRAPGAVWKKTGVPAVKSSGKIVACEGQGLDAQIMISLGRKDGITQGMLFEANSADGKRNVLVVTRVYDANAEVKLHPQYSTGNLTTGIALKKLDSLPR